MRFSAEMIAARTFIIKDDDGIKLSKFCWESVAGSDIQSTRMGEFEDFLRIQNLSEAGNNLLRVHTVPNINPKINSSCGLDQVPPGPCRGG